MARATGVGGVFFRAAAPASLARWYVEMLALPVDEKGHTLIRSFGGETLTWAAFPHDTDYFGPTGQMAMINYRVDDLDGVLQRLRAAESPSTITSKNTNTAALAGPSTRREPASSFGNQPLEIERFIAIQKRLRASAESADRIVDDHLPRERLHHFGFDRGQLSMLAWQAHRNAQTEAIFAPAMSATSTAALALERSA